MIAFDERRARAMESARARRAEGWQAIEAAARRREARRGGGRPALRLAGCEVVWCEEPGRGSPGFDRGVSGRQSAPPGARCA